VILNDILDLSKLDAGKVVLETTDFKPHELIHEVIDLLQHKAREKQITLSVHIDPGLPEVVNGDPHRLRQVLLNLISNAVKFTEQGSVSVSVQTISSRDGIELNCSIQDTGIGIAEKDKAHIFEQFNQADESMTRRFGGTGLGLAICKAIVEQMQGCLTFDSILGKGSTFSFTVLLDHPQDSDHFASSESLLLGLDEAVDDKINDVKSNSVSKSSSELVLDSSVNVLLVEDNPVNQDVIRMMLAKMGVQIQVMNNGQEAVDYFHRHARHNFDVILMDCQMPEMDGYQATEALLALWESQNNATAIPIIALTASTSSEDRNYCFTVGMDDYLSKPLNLETLFAMLLRWLPKKKIRVASDKPAVTPASDYVQDRQETGNNKNSSSQTKLLSQLFDVEALTELQSMMGDRFPEMVSRYRQNSFRLVNKMPRLSVNEPHVLRELLHSLKGSSAALAATRLTRLCQTMEDQLNGEVIPQRVLEDIKQIRKLVLVTVQVLKKTTEEAKLESV